MKAKITVGLPGSGKSTWAREYVEHNPNTVIVNNDSIRAEYMEREKIDKWTPTVENYVRCQRELMIQTAHFKGHDVIVDNTHMNPKTRKQIVDFCESIGYETELVDFQHVSVEECVQRDAQRSGKAQVGEKVIRDMYRKFSPRPAEGALPRWDQNSNLPKCIIVDIDGTAAEMVDRGPYDEHLVYNDAVREHVLATVRALQAYEGCKVIFMSGRSAKCHSETERYLDEKCKLSDYLLFMRAATDRRRDSEVKRDLYMQHIKDQYSVLAVFDDRAAVVRECWTPLGLPVFRCGVIDRDEF
jgi:predicted kinase